MKKTCIAITGGGTEFIGNYLSEGGKSDHFLEAVVPYSTESLDSFLGKSPDKYCSKETAASMAMRCFERCRVLRPELSLNDCQGIGVTASLYKDGQREDRKNIAYIAVQTLRGLSIFTEEYFEQDRKKQEGLLGKRIRGIICNHTTFFRRGFHKYYECGPLGLLYNKQENFRLYERFNSEWLCQVDQELPKNYILFPGSFNPMHDGHKEMIRKVNELYPDKCIFIEISLFNFDKPTVDPLSLQNRLNSIDTSLVDGVIVSNCKTFEEKIKYFNPFAFIIGFDTFCRIDDIEELDARFIMFPRKGGNRIIHRHNVQIIDCKIPDISSTEIRRNNVYLSRKMAK